MPRISCLDQKPDLFKQPVGDAARGIPFTVQNSQFIPHPRIRSTGYTLTLRAAATKKSGNGSLIEIQQLVPS